MPFFAKSKRVAAIAFEGSINDTNIGSYTAPNPTNDAFPVIRDATFNVRPIRVERPTLRRVHTAFPDTYPGRAVVDITIDFELVGRTTNPKANYDRPTSFVRAMQACGFFFVAENQELHTYQITSISGGPIRHQEALTGNSGGTPVTGNAFGDTFTDDGVIYVDESNTGSATLDDTTLTGGASGAVATVSSRDNNEIMGFRLLSEINNLRSWSVDLWADGHVLRTKGNMGNAEFQFRHGDAVVCRLQLTGILLDSVVDGEAGYAAEALPATPFLDHQVPATFLGSQVKLRSTTDNQTYGTPNPAASPGPTYGGFNELTLRTENTVVARENSIDPSGVSYAIITDRALTGSFNPDEVQHAANSAGQFDFFTKFVNGAIARLRTTIGGSLLGGGAGITADGRTFDFLTPGVSWRGVAHADRDGVQIFNADFACVGGDYDSTATGELPGDDNELTIVHR